MNRTRKMLLTTAVVGATSAVAGLGVFAAFTATTSNTGNTITAGSVSISDNDGDQAMYVLPAAGPGSTQERCIRVTYAGTLPSTVKLMLNGAVTNGTAFTLRVERGTGLTQGFADCAGFTPQATLYNGDLGSFPLTYATGVDARGSAWNQGDVVQYRFTVAVKDDPTPNAHTTTQSSGSHAFTWEARNN